MNIRFSAVLLSALLVAGATGSFSASADDAGRPACKPDTTFENDEVRIWFHSMTGFIRIVDKNTTSGQGMYFYKSRQIAELDAEGDEVRYMNLNRAFPGTSECEITETEEFVNMNITVTDSVRNTNGGLAGEATVTLSYHFNKSAYGAKFDLIVDSWPWAEDDTENHTLAYDFRMRAGNLNLEPAENGVGVEDENGEKQGYVEWAANATATYEDETEKEANVTASWTGNDSELDIRLEFVDVEGGYVNLYYDPWMGIGDYVIVLGRLIGLAPVEQSLPPGLGRIVRSIL